MGRSTSDAVILLHSSCGLSDVKYTIMPFSSTHARWFMTACLDCNKHLFITSLSL